MLCTFIAKVNLIKIEHFKAFILMLVGAESIHLVYEPPQDLNSTKDQASQKEPLNGTADPSGTENSEPSKNRGCKSCESRHPWYIPRKRKILLVAGSFFAISGIIISTAVVAFKNGVIDDFNRFRKRYEPITEEDFLGVGDAMKVGTAWTLRKVFRDN